MPAIIAAPENMARARVGRLPRSPAVPRDLAAIREGASTALELPPLLDHSAVRVRGRIAESHRSAAGVPRGARLISIGARGIIHARLCANSRGARTLGPSPVNRLR